MFRFWIREILGWCLILIGLYVFMIALSLLLQPTPPGPRIFEAPAFVLVGFVVFRGGIHLLKVAVAARVCLHAHAEAAKAPVVEKRNVKKDSPWDW